MMPVPVQGFLANLQLDGVDITDTVTSTPLDRTRTLLDKGTMDGTGVSQRIIGVESASLSVSGLLSQAEHNSLELTWAKKVPVPFVLTVAEGLTVDTSWDGMIALGSFVVTPVGDGNWEFTLDGDTSGAVNHTPSSP